MFKRIVRNLLDLNQKEVTRLEKIVAEINLLEEDAKKLKQKDFAKKTKEFQTRLQDGEDIKGILPEAFAVAREASFRTLGMRPYDVQLMASIALSEGKIIEQKTGEGKTLSAVPALYLRALFGKGAHLVTVNDYLARRDAGWNAPVFELLGLSVGVIVQENGSFVHDTKYVDKSHGDERLSHLKPVERKEAYSADITYGTNNEFGFDYLRDNMAQSLERKSQRGHYFAIVDEVDSVLIDEARTPLIISAPDSEPTEKYFTFANLVEKLDPETDFAIDEKHRAATLTEVGISKVEKMLNVGNLYEEDYTSIHHIENALRAKTLYHVDKDYVINDGQIVIVDEFTGRLMPGRRWSDGMHQAVEAKENLKIQQESKTLATISFQNYFRLYKVLSGMTGTAATEAHEFKEIYDLEVVVIPKNKSTNRKDHSDVIYKTINAKYKALADEIKVKQGQGQPVLVGTTSIEKNEIISNLLRREKIAHNVLNAKNHEKEALIIAGAGKLGAVTVATNMAGRGVDIVLGGAPPEKPTLGNGLSEKEKEKERLLKGYERDYLNWKKEHEKVVKAGGLHVIGTERHESRRIDNQLRGRSGRQGDPGSSKFYLSLEDDLMRIFGGEQIASLMNRLKLPDDQPIENKLIGRAVEQAQVKVESFHFDARKNVVEYDDVFNQQREVVYSLRDKILTSESVKDEILEKVQNQASRIIDIADKDGNIDIDVLIGGLMEIIPFDEASRNRVRNEIEGKSDSKDHLNEFVNSLLLDIYESREKSMGAKIVREIEKFAYLGSIDHLWIDHIDYIDGLREGVRLRAYGQRDPKVEFKNEAFQAFETLLLKVDEELSRRIFRIGVAAPQMDIPLNSITTNIDKSDMTGLKSNGSGAFSNTPLLKPQVSGRGGGVNLSKGNIQGNKDYSSKKIGRNDLCPCGSGKKYKKCGLINAPGHRG